MRGKWLGDGFPPLKRAGAVEAGEVDRDGELISETHSVSDVPMPEVAAAQPEPIEVGGGPIE